MNPPPSATITTSGTTGGNGAPEIARRTPRRVFSAQVSDHKPVTKGTFGRAMPGAGIIPLAELRRALESGGYTGDYDLEVILDDGLRIRCEEALRTAIAAFDRQWGSLGD